jgi:TrmH family RNA methyltransferase
VRVLRDRRVEVAEVGPHEFASAAQTESPQGVLAIAEIPTLSLGQVPVGSPFRLLVLDAVQDPGNVGALLRTAAALGVDATAALPGTVDLWNAKVVRSAMGAHFRHPALSCGWAQIDALCAAHEVPIWAADAGGSPVGTRAAPPRLALVVGNEGNGISEPARQRADQLVGITIAADVESLNVAVATGILLYELRR